MNRAAFKIFAVILALVLVSACANIIPPTGGKSDTTGPKLLSIKPQDSLLNTRLTRLEMKFDEYISVADVAKELQISPALSQNAVLSGNGKTVILKIADSLLADSTTYTINFGKAIKDIHEGNPYTAAPFIFSTGAWFDSLTLKGTLYDAASGMLDTSATTKVLLYAAASPYDIVSKQKPVYTCRANTKGAFIFEGLPQKSFRIFALKETAENLQFDNDEELIGFSDTVFNPAVDTQKIDLYLFKEIPDTAAHLTDTALNNAKPAVNGKPGLRGTTKSKTPSLDAKTFNYQALIDTSTIEKRTQELTEPIRIIFSRKVAQLNPERIYLSANSTGIELESKFATNWDSSGKELNINCTWKPNTVYTLRLLKGFAQDSSSNDLMPSKYFFRTKSDDDYGKIELHIPERYIGKPYLLQVLKDALPVYLNPITEGKIKLSLLQPGTYTIAIIEDANGDGLWTTGSLKQQQHAERVIPFPNSVLMKAGWEHVVDFEQKKKE